VSKKVAKAYSTKSWHGKTMYQCEICPWSTLDHDEIEKHAARHQADAAPKVRHVDTGLIGPSGGKIVREEVVEPVIPAEEDSDG
jgi:hypothetical protein